MAGRYILSGVTVNVNDRLVITTIEGSGELKPTQQLATSLLWRWIDRSREFAHASRPVGRLEQSLKPFRPYVSEDFDDSALAIFYGCSRMRRYGWRK